MYKRVKKFNLNTSDKAHGQLMLRNLFTSLLLHGKVETTIKRAKELKRFALRQISYYNRDLPVLVKKTWLKQNITTRKFFKKALENLERVKDDFRLSLKRTRFRAGDGALMAEVRILNFEPKKNV